MKHNIISTENLSNRNNVSVKQTKSDFNWMHRNEEKKSDRMWKKSEAKQTSNWRVVENGSYTDWNRSTLWEEEEEKTDINTFWSGQKTACLWRWNHCVGEDLIVYVTQRMFSDLFFFLHFFFVILMLECWLLCWISFVAVLLTFIALVIPFMRCFGWINVWPYTHSWSQRCMAMGTVFFVNKWNVNVEYSLGHFSQNHF